MIVVLMGSCSVFYKFAFTKLDAFEVPTSNGSRIQHLGPAKKKRTQFD